jgi:hypothetical protein
MVLLSLLLTYPGSAFAQPLDSCKIASSQWNIVSLGFPLRPERLANIPNPKILVIPYQLSGEAKYSWTASDKQIFLDAGTNIDSLSHGKTKISFLFSNTLSLAASADELAQRFVHYDTFKQSTFGFVSSTIRDADPLIDFTGVNAVILFGVASNKSIYRAEAMMFTKDPSLLNNKIDETGSKFFDPINTNEGQISNAILILNQLSTSVATHEMLHLYGLTDLYGGPNTPVGSRMADAAAGTILGYEQWVLGWLPDDGVSCLNPTSEISQDPTMNHFTLNYLTGDKVLIIPTGNQSAMIVDVVTAGQHTYLQYYSLDNNQRPPIQDFFTLDTNKQTIDLADFGGVTKMMDSPSFRLLVSGNSGSTVTLNLIPTSAIGSAAYQQLLLNAEASKLESKALLGARQDAFQKALADAADKAAADKAAADKAASGKAASDALAAQKAAAAKAALLKKTTIVCIKGKLVKTVTAVKPVCPAGYKKK